MQSFFVHGLRGAGLAALLCSPAVQVLAHDGSPADVQAQLLDLQRQLAEQRALIDTMARELSARRLELAPGARMTAEQLDSNRGTGNVSDGAIGGHSPGADIGTQTSDAASRAQRATDPGSDEVPEGGAARASGNRATDSPALKISPPAPTAMTQANPPSATNEFARPDSPPPASAIAKPTPPPASTAVARANPRPASSAKAHASSPPASSAIAQASSPPASSATAQASSPPASSAIAQPSSPPASSAIAQASSPPASSAIAQASSPPASSAIAQASSPPAFSATAQASSPSASDAIVRPSSPSVSPANQAANARLYAPANARANPTMAPASPQAGPVGKPPASRGRPPEVAPLFEQPGVLTPTGKFIFEPAMQFGYSSSNRVALVGYTIIPALLIGLVDVREVKRNTTTAILSGRFGLTNRLELDVKVPYVYRSDSTVSREIFTGTAVENVFSTSGKHVGDAELGMRYQLNSGGPDRAFYVGSLRLKSRTGRDPFSVVTDCAQRCVGPNASGTGLPLDLPTGSGFYSVQPGLTWLFPSDPAVFFGSVSYLHNLKRNNVSRTVLNGEQEFLGEVKPGDIVGFNFGMGLGLNEKASFSLGYDHSSIGRTRQNGVAVPGAVRTQLGTLLLGFSYRLDERRSLNVAVGAGLTRDTPDVTLTVRVPTSF